MISEKEKFVVFVGDLVLVDREASGRVLRLVLAAGEAVMDTMVAMMSSRIFSMLDQ